MGRRRTALSRNWRCDGVRDWVSRAVGSADALSFRMGLVEKCAVLMTRVVAKVERG